MRTVSDKQESGGRWGVSVCLPVCLTAAEEEEEEEMWSGLVWSACSAVGSSE